MQSDDPINFGTDDEKQVALLNAHAPEIFQDEAGHWYISSVEWPNRGVSVDRLSWEAQ
jgi:beta-fructofuranosidase